MSIKAEELIYRVQSRPAIWDKREKCHSNRSLVDRSWKEIAKEMSKDEGTLRKKWKYLREQFCVELGRTQQPCGEDGSQHTEPTKWPHFKSLQFLRDVVKPRVAPVVTTTNIYVSVPMETPSVAEDEKDPLEDRRIKVEPETEQKETLTNFETVLLNPHTPPQHEAPMFFPSERKRCYPSENETNYDIGKKKIHFTKLKKDNQQFEDEDLLFFKSLLPHVKRVKPSQKLLLRSKILEVVSQFAYLPQCLSAHTSRTYSSQSEDFNHPHPYTSPRTDSD